MLSHQQANKTNIKHIICTSLVGVLTHESRKFGVPKLLLFVTNNHSSQGTCGLLFHARPSMLKGLRFLGETTSHSSKTCSSALSEYFIIFLSTKCKINRSFP